MTLPIRSAVCVLIVIFTIGSMGVAAASDTAKPRGEPTDDKALLYLIAPEKSRVKWEIYLNDRLLWRTKGNAYGFVDVDPGLHWLLGNGGTQVEFVPGHTHYILCHGGMTTLSRAEGEELIAQVKRHDPPPSAKEIAAHSQRAKKWFGRWTKKLPDLGRIEIEHAQPPSALADTSGFVEVPRHAVIELEFEQTMTTARISTGDKVGFRVAENAEVDGRVWLLAGTLVEGTVIFSQAAQKKLSSGRFEIALSTATAVDGTQIPLIGRFATVGRPRGAKGAAYFGLIGLAAASSKMGREGYEIAGTRLHAWTRYDAWVRPSSAVGSAPGSDASEDRPCKARSSTELQITPEARRVARVEILLDLEAEIRSLDLVSVNGWKLRDPPRALRVSDREGGSKATFDEWDLLRHLPEDERVNAIFEAVLSDGSQVACTALLEMSVEGPNKKK